MFTTTAPSTLDCVYFYSIYTSTSDGLLSAAPTQMGIAATYWFKSGKTYSKPYLTKPTDTPDNTAPLDLTIYIKALVAGDTRTTGQFT